MKGDIIVIEWKGISNKAEGEIYLNGSCSVENVSFAEASGKHLKASVLEKYGNTVEWDKSDMVLAFIFEKGICVKVEYSIIIVPKGATAFTCLGNAEGVGQITESFEKSGEKEKLGYARELTEDYDFIKMRHSEMILIHNLLDNYYRITGKSKPKEQSAQIVEEDLPESVALLNIATAVDVYGGNINLFLKCRQGEKFVRTVYSGAIENFFKDVFVDKDKIYLRMSRR